MNRSDAYPLSWTIRALDGRSLIVAPARVQQQRQDKLARSYFVPEGQQLMLGVRESKIRSRLAA